MKVSLVGVEGVPLGKHKVKDPRLDQADKLVKADSKTYALVDVVAEEEASTADAIVASPEGRFDLIVKDLEFAETRLERGFDLSHGGWGGAPKFPQPMTIEFLLRAHVRTEGASSLTMASSTLTHMAHCGIYDQIVSAKAR